MSKSATTLSEQAHNAKMGHSLSELAAESGRPVRDIARDSGIAERRLNRMLSGHVAHLYMSEILAFSAALGISPVEVFDRARL